MIIRPAAADDAPFLRQALAYAADWRPGAPRRTPTEVMAVPELAHYISGWPRPGDAGVVAVGVDGDGDDEHGHGRAVGAAWWRQFSTDDAGYGFVDERTPELSIGVAGDVRGRGIGTELLQTLVAEAHRRALRALSLSVEVDNPAARLYARLGFQTVAEAGGGRTMMLRLGDCAEADVSSRPSRPAPDRSPHVRR